MFDSRSFDHQMRFFDRLLNDLKERGVQTVVIEMPVTREYQERLNADSAQRFHSTIAAHCIQYQAKCIDLSDARSFNHDDFLDQIHMSLAGGDKLAKTIAAKLQQQHIYRNSVAVTSLDALR